MCKVNIEEILVDTYRLEWVEASKMIVVIDDSSMQCSVRKIIWFSVFSVPSKIYSCCVI